MCTFSRAEMCVPLLRHRHTQRHTNTHTHAHTHTRAHTHMHTHTRVRACAHTYWHNTRTCLCLSLAWLSLSLAHMPTQDAKTDMAKLLHSVTWFPHKPPPMGVEWGFSKVPLDTKSLSDPSHTLAPCPIAQILFLKKISFTCISWLKSHITTWHGKGACVPWCVSKGCGSASLLGFYFLQAFVCMCACMSISRFVTLYT